jgi:hypothetical protein
MTECFAFIDYYVDMFFNYINECIKNNFDMDNLQIKDINKSPRDLGHGKTSPSLRARNKEKFNKKPNYNTIEIEKDYDKDWDIV